MTHKRVIPQRKKKRKRNKAPNKNACNVLGSSRTATVTAILHTLIVCNLFTARKIKRHCTHSAIFGVVSSPQLTFIAFRSRSKQVEEEIQIYIIIVLMEALHLYRQTTESSLALARHTECEKIHQNRRKSTNENNNIDRSKITLQIYSHYSQQ